MTRFARGDARPLGPETRGESAQPQDLEVWTQDLLIHIRYLPPTSKYREAGKEDIVQTFDPSRHYGVNLRRFLNYINLCLANKFRSRHSKRMKDALSNPRNVSIDTHAGSGDPGSVDDEYFHKHSEHLRRASEHLEKQGQERHRIAGFTDFVSRDNSDVGPAIGAILATDTHADATRFLRTTDAAFARMRTRLRQWGKCLVSGESVPRHRGPYNKRVKPRINACILAA